MLFQCNSKIPNILRQDPTRSCIYSSEPWWSFETNKSRYCTFPARAGSTLLGGCHTFTLIILYSQPSKGATRGPRGCGDEVGFRTLTIFCKVVIRPPAVV